MNILHEIVGHKRAELAELVNGLPVQELKARIQDLPPARDMVSALRQSRNGRARSRIIAEVKKASPSKGIIREEFDPVAIAKCCADNGAAAISVLTESRYFMGEIEFLRLIAEKVEIPLLRKDFIFDEYQIYETRAYRGDAFLLIAAILSGDEIRHLSALGMELGITPMVEIHDREDLGKISGLSVPIIGINNRDLTTFRTDIKTTMELLPLLPRDVVRVSESGINRRGDVELLEKEGVDAFLVGEALMREADVGPKLRQLCGFTG